MGYLTFGQAKDLIESAYGDCDNVKLGTVINKIRRHFYNWYEELALFMDATECFRLHRFCVDCNECHQSYQGVTLPREFQTVEAIWWNDWPLKMQSSWREYQVGISPECDRRLEKYDMPGTVCTAVDLNPRSPQRVTFRALDEADTGKRLLLRGIGSTGQPVTMDLVLSTDLQIAEWPLRSIDRSGGVIKDRTAGRVLLSAEDGTLLAMYEPDETVPAYKRIKITGVPDNCGVVNIRASRRYFDLVGDDDVVETDNSVALDAMARYIRLYERAEKTRDTLTVEKDHYQTAFRAMMGDKAREVGKGTKAELAIHVPTFGGGRFSKLRGRGGRPWQGQF